MLGRRLPADGSGVWLRKIVLGQSGIHHQARDPTTGYDAEAASHHAHTACHHTACHHTTGHHATGHHTTRHHTAGYNAAGHHANPGQLGHFMRLAGTSVWRHG